MIKQRWTPESRAQKAEEARSKKLWNFGAAASRKKPEPDSSELAKAWLGLTRPKGLF